MTRFYRFIGLCFALIGVLHLMMGLVLYRRWFIVMMTRGFVNTVHQETAHQLAFWFTFAGPMMLLIGYLMDWVVRQRNGLDDYSTAPTHQRGAARPIPLRY